MAKKKVVEKQNTLKLDDPPVIKQEVEEEEAEAAPSLDKRKEKLAEALVFYGYSVETYSGGVKITDRRNPRNVVGMLDYMVDGTSAERIVKQLRRRKGKVGSQPMSIGG